MVRYSRASRIREFAGYVAFTGRDLERLRRIGSRLEQDHGALGDIFYRWLLGNPTMARVLVEGPEQIDRLKGTLAVWAHSLFADRRHRRYEESRWRIGVKHLELGLEQKYVLGAFAIVRSFYADRIRDLVRDQTVLTGVLESFHKALDLDICLISEAYSVNQADLWQESHQREQDVFSYVQYLLLKGRQNLVDLEPIRAALSRLYPVDHLCIAMHRTQTASVEIYGSASADQQIGFVSGLHAPIEEFPLWSVIEAGTPVDRTLRRESASKFSLMLQRTGIRRLLGLPLWIDHGVTGVLCFGTSRARGFEGTCARLFRTVADSIAMAVGEAEAVDRLAHSEEQYRSLFGSVSDAIYTADTNHRVTLCNDILARLVGRSIPEIGGELLEDVLPRERSRMFLNRHRDVLATGSSLQVESTMTVGGSPRQFLWRFMPVRDARTRVTGVMAIGTDVTQARQETAHHLHRHKMAALGLLATGIAHEVANPLAAIGSMAQELSDTIDDIEARHWLERITRQTQRAARTLRQMLDYARPPRDVHEGTAVEPVLRSTSDIASFDPRSRRVRIHLEVVESLPPVAVAPDALSQVFLNLLLNAFDAIGDRSGEIAIRVDVPGDRVRIDVRDSGPGIDPGYRNRIFEPFFSTKGDSAGCGLGLYMSRQILEGAGGGLTLEDEGGPGARFVIMLPVFEPVPVTIGSGLRHAEDGFSTMPVHETKGDRDV